MDDQYLYRLNSDASLLYIGISEDWSRRMRQHWNDKPWATEIRTITLETHKGRVAVEAAERAAIRAEHPLHNIQHNRASPLSALPVGRQWTPDEVIAATALAIFAAWVLWQVGTAAHEHYRSWQENRAEFRAWKASHDTGEESAIGEVSEPEEENPAAAMVGVSVVQPVPSPAQPTSNSRWLSAAALVTAYYASPSRLGESAAYWRAFSQNLNAETAAPSAQ